jgi:hypothetical protein
MCPACSLGNYMVDIRDLDGTLLSRQRLVVAH